MMKPAFAIKRDYGVQELKRIYGKNLMRGLRYSLVLNLLAIGSYWGIDYVQPKEETQSVAVRITKYEELVTPPSITNKTFGLSAYPVLAQPPASTEKYALPKVRPGPRNKKFKENIAARGLGEIRGDLPSAPGANKIEPAKLLADIEDNSKNRPYDDVNAVGGGGNSDERFHGGVLIASKDGIVSSGNAHSGVGSNPHQILGGEGNNGGGQGGDEDRFGSGSGDSFGYSMSWLRGGTRRKLSGALPKYPAGVNVEAQISILAVVSPEGSIKSVQPAQKANTQLENAAMKELRYWKFEPLRSSAPQIDQSCVVTFNFKLK
jgi:hypothetical protein